MRSIQDWIPWGIEGMGHENAKLVVFVKCHCGRTTKIQYVTADASKAHGLKTLGLLAYTCKKHGPVAFIDKPEDCNFSVTEGDIGGRRKRFFLF